MLVLAGLIFFLPGQCQSYEIYFRHLTVDQGLSQNSVVSITQDNAGYMWMATQDGLNQYDGSSIVKVNRFFDDITETDYSVLGKVIKSSDGALWISSLNGVTEMRDPVSGKMDTISTQLPLSAMAHLGDDEYLLGSYGKGLMRYQSENNVLQPIVVPGQDIYSLLHQGNLTYIVTDKGIYTRNESGQITQLFDKIPGSNYNDVAFSQDGIMYVSTFGKGLYREQGHSLVSIENIPDDLNIQDIHFDREDRLWIATYGNGLYMIDEDIHHFLHEKGNPRSIGYNDILCIYESKEGILWFGSDGGGVSYYDPESFKFKSLINDLVPDDIHVDVARSISRDPQGNLWIGTSGFGLTYYQPETGYLHTFTHDPDDPGSIGGNRIVSLLHDRIGRLWIGTQENGLYLMSSDYKFKKIVDVDANTIWVLQNDGNGNIWIGSRHQGLILYNENEGILHHFSNEDFPHMKSNNIRAIVKKEADQWYVGTQNDGVFIVDLAEETILPVPQKITAKEIKSIHANGEKLWIGTAKNGIGLWNEDTKQYISVTEDRGLPNNVVYSIMPGNRGELWISTNKGICSFSENSIDTSKVGPVFNCYGVEDGLQGMEFNTGAYYRAEDGTLFFGGLKGVNWVNPGDVNVDDSQISPLITEIRVKNEKLDFDSFLYFKKSVDLDYNQHFFSVRYITPDYRQQSEINYAYRLLGLNDNWTYAEQQEVANFTNIPPDDYTFEVALLDKSGLPGQARSSIHISIEPAFWQTWWFYTLCVLTLGFIVFAVYKIRITQVRQEQAKLTKVNKKIAEIEMKALQAQMNPHFLFNSLNSVKSLVSRGENDKAVFYLTKFSKLIRQILNNSRKKFIRLNEETEALRLYLELESMRFNQNLDYNITIEERVNEDFIEVPSLILQPYVENAIWHGLRHKENGDWKLDIHISRNGDFVIMVVEDNGIGRAQSAKIGKVAALNKESLGMKINDDRMTFLQEIYGKEAKVKVEDLHDPTGTRVVIQLPIPD